MAALLISRQVIGNLKESALPYMLEHMRLAKMSFDLWGALSPTVPTKSMPGDDDVVDKKNDVNGSGNDADDNKNTRQASAKRSMSQAELESSLYKVSKHSITLFHTILKKAYFFTFQPLLLGLKHFFSLHTLLLIHHRLFNNSDVAIYKNVFIDSKVHSNFIDCTVYSNVKKLHGFFA